MRMDYGIKHLNQFFETVDSLAGCYEDALMVC